MSEPKQYRAKLVDQISEKSRQYFQNNRDQEGTLVITWDNRVRFIPFDTTHIGFDTSTLQADPVFRDGEIIFVTRNSTYIFEIIEEVIK